MSEEKAERARGDGDVPDPPAWATVPRPGNGRRRGPAERLPESDFPLALRGYDRAAVDEYVADTVEFVSELETARMSQPAVQRALEEVGKQTSEILRQAHQTAEEITARSRAQAEGRLQRAEREAAAIRRDAEHTARRLEGDNEQLWKERGELIAEIRAMAQDVLAVADAALERLPPPGANAARADEDQGASRSIDHRPPAAGR